MSAAPPEPASSPLDTAQGLTAAQGAAAHAALPDHEALILSGADALTFLNRLCTLDVRRLPVGGASLAHWLDVRGRVQASAWLARLGDDTLHALLAPGQAEPLATLLDHYHFGEAFQAHPAAGRWRSLVGPAAPDALEAIGWPVPALGQLAHHPWGFVMATDRLGAVSFDAWIAAPADPTVAAQLCAAGAPEIGPLTLERLRILHGAAAHPAEYGDHGSPLDVGMAGITDGKGCYPGQEVIERTLALGRPARMLTRLTLTGPAQPGAELLLAGKAVGRLTSAVALPDGRWIGLGLVRRSLADDLQPLAVGDTAAEVQAHRAGPEHGGLATRTPGGAS